jgi:carotenoid 1,2-hydratase
LTFSLSKVSLCLGFSNLIIFHITLKENFSISSSITEDVWHQKTSPKAYEWWYFDAVSDDGRDAVVIIFLDNFVFSPQYNSSKNPKVPAVSFTYYRDGKPLYRVHNEFDEKQFQTSQTEPFCKIGDSEFSFEKAPYGSGYSLTINATLHKNRKLKANFEWLSIESDFLANVEKKDLSHCWNLVVPRADVTGNIEVFSKTNKLKDKIQFRGTGYHDHNFDNRWLPETVDIWQWGRCHYADATVTFYRYKEINGEPITKLFLVREGEYKICDASYERQNQRRDRFGLKYPQRIKFVTENNVRLRVKQDKIIDSSFFYLRFLSEMTLTLRDGNPRKMIGITEHLSPKSLKWRWLDWLINMRIGRNGKGSFLP